MATVKSSLVIKHMRDRNYPMFEVLDGNLIVCEQRAEGYGLEAAIEKLQECLGEISGNDVTITICGKLNNSGSFVRGHSVTFDRVDITPVKTKPIGDLPDQTNYASVQKFIDKNLELEKKIIQMEADRKYEDLRRELDQLRNEKSSTINGIFDKLIENPQIQNVLGSLLGNALGVPQNVKHLAGLNSDNETSINRIKKVDPDFDIHLAMLAELSEKAPATYHQAISFLKMQFDQPTIES